MLQHPSGIVQTEQQRTYGVFATLVPAKPRHHTVGRARVLHLDHRALAWQVSAGLQLRNHTVETCAFEAREPVERERTLPRCRCEIDWWLHIDEQLLEGSTAHRLCRGHEVASCDREHVESDEG